MATMKFTFDPNVDPNAKPQGGDFAPTPEGTHDLKILSMQQEPPGAGKQWGSIATKYEVVGSADATAIGRSRTFWLQLSPKATPYFLIPFIKATGVVHTTGTEMTSAGPIPTIEFDPDLVVGAVVKARCSHQQGNNGKVREDWSDFAVSELNPLLAGQGAPAMQPPPQQPAMQPYAPQSGPQGYAQPGPQGYAPQPGPQYAHQGYVQQAPQGMPAPQGAMPPRRFG